MLAVGLMALPLDERAPSVGGDVAQDGGPAGVGFSHVEDLLTAVTPDCLLHLSALTRPRAQDEGSKGAPLRIFADLVERRTDVSQNAQRQLWWRLIRLVGRQHGIVDPWRSGYLDVAAQHVMHDSTAPNTSPRNSEAPLAIFGCAVKPGSEAIKR